MPNIIEIENLSKQYDQKLAVDHIGFTVKQGDLFAFLGTNGAGKSTTINMICTLLAKSSGKIRVDGLDMDTQAAAIRHRIGIVFQENVLDDLLTVADNLNIRGKFQGLADKENRERLAYLKEQLDLQEVWARPFGKLSGGQKRKCEIARALIGTPKLLILDEPTTGLDPQTRKSIWEVIRTLQTEYAMSVFLTTHYMEEAAAADDVVILEKGRICASGTPMSLKSKYGKDTLRLRFPDTAAGMAKLAGLGYPAQQKADVLSVTVDRPREALELLNRLDDFIDFELIKGNMDDVFLKVTGYQEVPEQ